MFVTALWCTIWFYIHTCCNALCVHQYYDTISNWILW